MKITKKEIKTGLKDVAVGRGYKGGYVVGFNNSNRDASTKKEVVKIVIEEVKDGYVGDITVTSFDELDVPFPPVTIVTIEGEKEEENVAQKTVLDMENKDVKKHINEFLNKNLNVQKILENVGDTLHTGNDIYLNNNQKYQKIFDIITPDSAGNYIQLEILEFFELDFNLSNNNNYYNQIKYDLIEYIDYFLLSYINDYIDDHVNSKLKNGVNYYIDYIEGGFGSFMVADVDVIPPQVEEAFRDGVDKHLITNITDGYISFFEIDGVPYYLYSFYSEDDKQFYYNYIEGDQKLNGFLKQEITNFLKDAKRDFYEFVAVKNFEEYKKLGFKMYQVIFDIIQYNNIFFDTLKQAENQFEMFNDLMNN